MLNSSHADDTERNLCQCNVHLRYPGRLVSGICGASYTVATAYRADVSDDSNRAKNFGLMGAGFGLGFILGPSIGGLVASKGPADFFGLCAFVSVWIWKQTLVS